MKTIKRIGKAAVMLMFFISGCSDGNGAGNETGNYPCGCETGCECGGECGGECTCGTEPGCGCEEGCECGGNCGDECPCGEVTGCGCDENCDCGGICEGGCTCGEEQPILTYRIYLCGDSTCASKPQDQRPMHGWGEKLQQFFDRTNAKVDNRAKDGRSTKTFLADWTSIEVALRDGDWVFLQFGHNDNHGPSAPESTTPDEYAGYLKRYVDEARARGALPVILTPVVRRNFSGNTLNDTHGQYPAKARAVAAEKQVPLIDMEQMSRELVTSLGPAGSQYLYMVQNNDNTHLTEEGALEYAGMVVEGIVELNLKALVANLVEE